MQQQAGLFFIPFQLLLSTSASAIYKGCIRHQSLTVGLMLATFFFCFFQLWSRNPNSSIGQDYGFIHKLLIRNYITTLGYKKEFTLLFSGPRGINSAQKIRNPPKEKNKKKKLWLCELCLLQRLNLCLCLLKGSLSSCLENHCEIRILLKTGLI